MRIWGQAEGPNTEQFAIVKEKLAIHLFSILNDCKRFFLAWGLGWHINVYCGCQKYSPFHSFVQTTVIFQSQFLKFRPCLEPMTLLKIFNRQFLYFLILRIQVLVNSSGGIYKRCYFCLSQLPKTKKESTANIFVGQRGRGGHKEPAELTVLLN